MSVQDFIALGIVAVAVVYAARSFLRTLGGQTGCGGGCGCSKNDAVAPDRKLKQIPLVTLGGVGGDQELKGPRVPGVPGVDKSDVL